MRNLKKFLALVLATLMMVSAAAVVSADFTDVAADNRYAAAINDLAVKGIVKGTTETTFNPTADVTRTQMAIFLARTLSGEVEDDARWTKGIVPYTDVTEYAGAIEYVQVKGLINGWTDINGKLVFGPKDNVTYVQALKMAIGALGYTEELAWPWGYYNKAVELGLTANMDVSDLNAELNRAETAQIIYNVLYAEPAEGEYTLAETNFGIATVRNTDLFVITATPKQYYAKDYEGIKYDANASEVDGDYVGIQALVNGVPSGNMIYVPVEKLGIAVADVENYFNYAVELINYDKETGEFAGAILGEAPTVVDHTKVGYINSTKAKINGKTYTTVDVLTDATLNNELVIFNGAFTAGNAKMLVVDEDGYVYFNEDNAVAKLAYTSSNGTAYYHAYETKTANGVTVTKGTIVPENKALAVWGVEVLDEAGAYIEYATMKASALYNDAYQLALYDDDRDGLFERAVYNKIYMGVYTTFKGKVNDKDTVCDGMVKELNPTTVWGSGVNHVAATAVTYTDAAAKEYGAISVFTFNPQLNKVNVIDVLEVQTGTIDKVNATGFRSHMDDARNVVKFTVDGTVYTIAYDMSVAAEKYNSALDGDDYKVLASQLGADILEVARDYGVTVDELGEEAFLQIDVVETDSNNTKEALEAIVDENMIGKDIAFVAYNGYILMFDEVVSEDAYNFALVDSWTDFDLGEIYMDLWIAGELEEDATVIEIDGKELADLSTTKFSLLLSKDELFWPGNLYALDVVDEGYALTDLITTTKQAEAKGLKNAKVANDDYAEYAAALETSDKVTVDGIDYTNADDIDGLSIVFDNGNAGTGENKLRTNDDTIFYFVTYDWIKDMRGQKEDDEFDREVKVWTGDVADGLWIKFDKNTKIWTDTLGRGDRASVVFVIDPAATNFFASEVTYVIGNITNWLTLDIDYAEKYGLPEEYEDETIYKYTGNFYDPYTGEKVATAVYALDYKNWKGNGNCSFYINEDNVIVAVSEDNNGTLVADVNIDGNALKNAVDAESFAVPVLTYINGTRNYAKYGISNKNTNNVTSAANNSWGKADYATITEANAKLVNDGRKLYVKANNTYTETEWKNGAWTNGVATHVDVLNYFDWYYAKQTKEYDRVALENNNVDKFPANIYDVELYDNIIKMEWDGDWLKSLEIVGKGENGNDLRVVGNRYNQDIEVKVFYWNNANALTGEEAYKVLATAPQVWYVTDLDAAMADGVMEFYVLTTAGDK